MHSEILKLINSVWNKKDLPEQQKVTVIVPIDTKGDKTDCSNYQGMPLLSTTFRIYPTFFSKHLLHMQMKLFGINRVDAGQNYHKYR